jgi:hypothetical protein
MTYGTTSRHDDGLRGNGANTSRGRHAVLSQDFAHRDGIHVGEDHADVALDVRQQVLIGCVLRVEDGTADHGVLAHQDLAVATESNAHELHLLGANVVAAHDEHTLVSLQVVL